MADFHLEHSLAALSHKPLGGGGHLGILERYVSLFCGHAPLTYND
jgi:hypothetical protein